MSLIESKKMDVNASPIYEYGRISVDLLPTGIQIKTAMHKQVDHNTDTNLCISVNIVKCNSSK